MSYGMSRCEVGAGGSGDRGMEVETKPTIGGYADVNGIKLYPEGLRPGRNPGSDPWQVDDNRRDREMGAGAGEDAPGDRCRDAGPRPHRGYGPADELRHDGR